jgi:membrane associated rhomboid family serine protease
MAGTPDLFVVCKNCGSEVSPYITECPYCGNRLRKRAPKIERDASGESRPKERRRAPRPPSLGRLRAGEIPGIRVDEDRRPYVTMALVVLGALGFLTLAFVGKADVALFGPPGAEVWRYVTAPFVQGSAWSQLAVLVPIAVFGTLLERRHGPVVVLVLWLVAASGGVALAAELGPDFTLVLGANGAALAFIAAWAVPVLFARRRDGPDADEADLLGALVLAVLVAALPLADTLMSPVAGSFGGVVGLLTGVLLARARPR